MVLLKKGRRRKAPEILGFSGKLKELRQNHEKSSLVGASFFATLSVKCLVYRLSPAPTVYLRLLVLNLGKDEECDRIWAICGFDSFGEGADELALLLG